MITSFRLTLILFYLHAETKERMSSGDDGFMFAVSLYCVGRLGESECRESSQDWCRLHYNNMFMFLCKYASKSGSGAESGSFSFLAARKEVRQCSH